MAFGNTNITYIMFNLLKSIKCHILLSFLALHGGSSELIIQRRCHYSVTFCHFVDTVEVPQTVFWHYTRFSGSLSSLDITNGNRSHNKPLELIETI